MGGFYFVIDESSKKEIAELAIGHNSLSYIGTSTLYA